MQVTEHLGGPRLGYLCLRSQRRGTGFPFLTIAESDQRSDDGEAPRPSGQRRPRRPWRAHRTPLAENQPWRTQVEIPLRISPRPAILRQRSPEGFRHEGRYQQRRAQPGQGLPRPTEMG